MRAIRYGVAMSLDGYIAGPNGEADWIVHDPEIDFKEIFSRFDTLLVGRKTYEAMLKMGGGGGSMPGVKSYVISRTMKPSDHPKVTIVPDVGPLVTKLKAEPGKDIWLFGGGELFRSMLDAGLVDGVDAAIVPVLLGGGIPFLPSPAQRAKLKLRNRRIYEKSGIVALEYEVVRPATTRRSGRSRSVAVSVKLNHNSRVADDCAIAQNRLLAIALGLRVSKRLHLAVRPDPLTETARRRGRQEQLHRRRELPRIGLARDDGAKCLRELLRSTGVRIRAVDPCHPRQDHPGDLERHVIEDAIAVVREHDHRHAHHQGNGGSRTRIQGVPPLWMTAR